jgi:DNA-binding response OmpR family regulator
MVLTPQDEPLILLIEDDRTLQDLYFEGFTNHGLRVIQAYDGEQGVQMAQTIPNIRVMIVDIMLPTISGFDVIQQIRSTAIAKNIPILVVSALTSEADRATGLKAGATEYIGKDELMLKDLIEKVKLYADL